MQDDKLFNLFSIAYEIAHNKDSLASFPDRCAGAELRVYKSSKEADPLHLDLGTAYRNRNAVNEMIFFLDQVQKAMDKSRVRKGANGLFGSAIDEATDLSMDQGLIQYVKFVEIGTTQTLFLGIRDLTAQDSTTIFETHQESLAELFDGNVAEMHKHHVTMGTDGCSSMIGTHKGVTAQFKQENPRLVSVWCHAHRWSLVVKDAAKEIDELMEWQDVFDAFYRFFSRSVKRRKALLQSQQVLGEEFLSLICDIDTRWLTKGQAISRLAKIYFSLHRMLSDSSNLGMDAAGQERVAELRENLQSHYFLVILHGLDSILQWCNTVSVVFQQQNLTGTTVQTALVAFEKGLTGSWLEGDLYQPIPAAGNPIHNLCKEIGNVSKLDKEGGTYDLSNGADYQVKVTCKVGDHTKAMKVLRRFASFIVSNKNERMGDASEASKFEFLAPSAIPVDKQARATHGDEDFAALTRKYCEEKTVGEAKHPALFNKNEANVPWAEIKEELAERRAIGGDISKDAEIIAGLFKDRAFSSRFPFVMFLYIIMLNLWLETAECERGFSVRTQIKTKQRASMQNRLLDALMRLAMNGPSLYHPQLFSRFIGDAIVAFKAHRVRFPQRSAAGIPRKSITRQSALSQLLQWAEFVEAGKEEDQEILETPGIDVFLELPDVVRETQEAREARERAEEESERSALSRIGPYTPVQGWAVDPLPADIPFPGVPHLCKATERFLKQKDVACKFVEGWKTGTVHDKQEKSVKKGSKGFFAIKVKGVTGWLLYDLKKDTYGQDWVLLSKC